MVYFMIPAVVAAVGAGTGYVMARAFNVSAAIYASQVEIR